MKQTRFWRDEDGSFIIFGLALFMLMIFAGGLAVDVMRYEAHRAKVQQTLDRAILAAASLDQDLDPKVIVLDYFAKAGLEHVITEDDITVETDAYSRKVTARLRMRMGTTFLRMGNYYSLDLPAAGQAEESTSVTEISLVVDVSGSMSYASASGRSKIYELREAAKKFANITMCNPTDAESIDNCIVEPGVVSISLVPYAEQVLLGSDLAAQFSLTEEHSHGTCVTFDSADFEVTALSPETLIKRTGHFDPYGRSDNAPREGNMPCQTDDWREVHVFEDDVTALHAEIDALGASGNTSIDLGMKWGAALLDPAAQGAVTGLVDEGVVAASMDGRPMSYATRGLSKVIVLMSDGANTSQDYLRDGYRSGPSPIYRGATTGGHTIISVYNAARDEYYWQAFGVYRDHPFGARAGETYDHCYWARRRGNWYSTCDTYTEADGADQLTYPQVWESFTTAWFEQFSWLGDPASSYGYSDKNDKLDRICSAAKEAGIVVFTVGFEVDGDQDAVMRNCATADSYYFDVDGLDISSAFSAIAREISKLRLVL